MLLLHSSHLTHLLTADRYNQKWNRSVQNAIFTILFCGWLGGVSTDSKPGELGRLVTIEEVGAILKGTSTSPPFITSRNH